MKKETRKPKNIEIVFGLIFTIVMFFIVDTFALSVPLFLRIGLVFILLLTSIYSIQNSYFE